MEIKDEHEQKIPVKPLIVLSIIIVAVVAVVYAALLQQEAPHVIQDYPLPESRFPSDLSTCSNLVNEEYRKVCSDFIKVCDDEESDYNFRSYCTALVENDPKYCDNLPEMGNLNSSLGREYCYTHYYLSNLASTDDMTLCDKLSQVFRHPYRGTCEAIVQNDPSLCDNMKYEAGVEDHDVVIEVCKATVSHDLSVCDIYPFEEKRSCLDASLRGIAWTSNDVSFCERIINAKQREECKVEVTKDASLCDKPVYQKVCYEAYLVLDAMERGDKSVCDGFLNETKRDYCKLMIDNSDVSGIERCSVELDADEMKACVDSFTGPA